MRLKAAVVDVGGTLWPDRWPPASAPLYVHRLREEFALSHDQVDRLMRELELRDPALANRPPLMQNSHEMAAQALRVTGLGHIPPGHLLQTLDLPAFGVIELHPGAGHLLRKLKSLRIRCVILSNATFRGSAGLSRDFRDLGIGDLVGEVISSVDTGLRKPHPRMFQLALSSAGSLPEETVFIGDSEETDIIPAKQLGMQAIRMAIEEGPPESTAADVINTSLWETAELLERWVEMTSS